MSLNENLVILPITLYSLNREEEFSPHFFLIESC